MTCSSVEHIRVSLRGLPFFYLPHCEVTKFQCSVV